MSRFSTIKEVFELTIIKRKFHMFPIIILLIALIGVTALAGLFRMIFDDINQPIFFDQIHTGDFGNKIIAEKIYEKILPIVSKDLSN